MARWTNSVGRVLRRPRVRVRVNGYWRADVRCRSIVLAEGIGGNSAVITLPRARVGEDWSGLDQAKVEVFLGGGNVPEFVGHLQVQTQVQDGGQDRVAFVARSVMWRADGLRVGQVDRTGVLLFPRRDVDGNATGWSVTRVVEELFRAERMPGEWLDVVGLGDVRAIAASRADQDLPDLALSGSYAEALARVLAFVPDIGVRERYEASGKVLLDFFVIGRGHGAVRVMRGADATTGPAEGAYARIVNVTRDTRGVYSRAIGYGSAYQHQVTLWTGHGTAPIVPAWPGSEDVDPTDPLTYGAAETRVLGDPGLATPGSERYSEALGMTFRRWRLPLVARENLVRARNALRDVTGQELAIQVFRSEFAFGEFTAFPWEASGFKASEWELLRGWELDDEGFLTLGAPAVAMSSMTGDLVRLNLFTPVFVTCTLLETRAQRRSWYDTGVRPGLRFPGLEGTGFVLDFVNEDLRLARRGAVGLADSTGTEHTFGELHWDADAEEWDVLAAGEVEPIANDIVLLAGLTERAIAERSRVRTTVEVGEVLLHRVRVGDPFVLLGRGVDGVVCTAYAVQHDLDTGSTTVAGSDQRPAVVRPAERVSERMRGLLRREMAGAGNSAPRSHGGTEMGGSGGGTLADVTEDMRRAMR